jgi:hypothetical protein
MATSMMINYQRLWISNFELRPRDLNTSLRQPTKIRRFATRPPCGEASQDDKF